MARFAFVVPPLVGHTNPTISVGRELTRRGHEVSWIGYADVLGRLLPQGARIEALPVEASTADLATVLERARTVRLFDGLKLLYQDFLVPLAHAMLPGVQAAVERLRPDVLIVDRQAIAGSLVARRLGVRWATFSTTTVAATDPLATLPKVKAWVDAQVAGLQEAAGLPVIPDGELSPSLVVVFSVEALVGPLDRFPAHYRFVGASIQARPDPTPFPFEQLDPDRRRVLVSMGTISADRRDGFHDTVVAAFADDAKVQIVLVAPEGALSAPPPAGMIVRPRVPQLALLPRMDAVVSHAGINTVCEALSHGLPQVVAPIRDDQTVMAQQVVNAGCGLRVRYGRLSPQSLREALHRVLEEPSFREAAARVRASLEAAGGAPRAATLLEELAR